MCVMVMMVVLGVLYLSQFLIDLDQIKTIICKNLPYQTTSSEHTHRHGVTWGKAHPPGKSAHPLKVKLYGLMVSSDDYKMDYV